MATLLANLLVSATGIDDDLSAEGPALSGDSSSKGACNHVQSQLREETSRNASRKARVLSKHRSVLVRWEEIPTTNSPAPKMMPCSPLKQDHPPFSNQDGKVASTNDTAGIKRTSATFPVFIRSDLLSLKHNENLGRHLVAIEAPIPIGTLLLRERPYAWCLQPELSGELCAHCLHKVTSSAFPCTRCGLVAFCSATCAEDAWKDWHGNECLDNNGNPLAPALSGLSSECRLALRALRRNLLEETSEQSTISSPGVARRSSTLSNPKYARELAMGFSDLQEHYIGRSPRQQALLQTEVAIAAVLASGGGGRKSASSNRVVNGPGDRSIEELRGSLAAKLATALVKVTTNAFAVSTLRSTEPAVGHVQSVNHSRVAVGLYCTAAMLNHSCVPNALATFDGGEMRITTTRVIDSEEPVTISYGPLLSKISSTSQRQSLLRSAYFFHCECHGCHRNPVAMVTSHPYPGSSNLQNVADTRSQVTEFGCLKSRCSGMLVAVVPPMQSQPQCYDWGGETMPQGCSSSSSLEVFLQCDRCGTRLSQRSANMLLKEDENDRRLWVDARLAVARCEDQVRREGGLGGKGKVVPSGEASPDMATVAKELITQRAHWRDRHLSLASMRRAIAHDAHARLLAMEGDFASAADACTRALQVLVRRFSPEDRELGVEYLKLAELCFNAGLVERCMTACQHARVSLDVCLAPNDEQIISLRNMQAACAAQLFQPSIVGR